VSSLINVTRAREFSFISIPNSTKSSAGLVQTTTSCVDALLRIGNDGNPRSDHPISALARTVGVASVSADFFLST
jgi:hypothetical protein